MRGQQGSKEQDGTYLFEGGQEHMGVAGHFHDCPGERRVVRAGLRRPDPSPGASSCSPRTRHISARMQPRGCPLPSPPQAELLSSLSTQDGREGERGARRLLQACDPRDTSAPLAWSEGPSGPDHLLGRGNILTLFITGEPVCKS